LNRGYVKLWRKSFDSGWLQNHKLWAFWTWCLLKASHKEYDAIVGLQVVHLLPGQFIFGRRKAAEETGLSEREIRTIVEFLRNAGNMTNKTTNKFSIITIINWGTYQGDTLENDQQNDQQVTSHRPHTNTIEHKNKNNRDFSSEISAMRDRYPDQEIIHRAFQAVASVRKSKRIADSVRMSILKSWERFPVTQVTGGIRTYLEKGCADQGKGERYLLGIIRNSAEAYGDDADQGFKSTGSPLLDAYRRGELGARQ